MYDSSLCGYGVVWLLARKGTLSAAESITYLALGSGHMSVSVLKNHENYVWCKIVQNSIIRIWLINNKSCFNIGKLPQVYLINYAALSHHSRLLNVWKGASDPWPGLLGFWPNSRSRGYLSMHLFLPSKGLPDDLHFFGSTASGSGCLGLVYKMPHYLESLRRYCPTIQFHRQKTNMKLQPYLKIFFKTYPQTYFR